MSVYCFGPCMSRLLSHLMPCTGVRSRKYLGKEWNMTYTIAVGHAHVVIRCLTSLCLLLDMHTWP